MNKEIKFRGLQTDGKGWVYGYLIISESAFNKNLYCIIDSKNHFQLSSTSSGNLCYSETNTRVHEVLPESVGQFIETINDQEVFDGDIFCIKHSQYSYYVKIEDGIQAICYHVKKKDWDDKSPLRWGALYRIKELGWENEFHITGNIHQNPELI